LDAILVFSVHESQLPREASLQALQELLMSHYFTGKTFHHAVYGEVAIQLHLEVMTADMKERHLLCRVVEPSGENSVCIKCHKTKKNIHIHGEDCTSRSNDDFEKFCKLVKNKIEEFINSNKNNDQIRKPISDLEKKYGYRYAQLLLATI
jgi:hypothetical protein